MRQGVIRLVHVNDDEIIEYYVSANKLEVVDIPVGYTHNIEKFRSQILTIMWVNEMFDPNQPDTIYSLGGIAHGKLKLMTIVGIRP